MKVFILIIIGFLQSIFCLGQTKGSLVYSGDQLNNLMLNDSVPFSVLYEQTKDFFAVRKIGKVKKKECVESPVDETCVFTFSNMKITYINLNSKFELSEIVVFGKESGVLMNVGKIFIGDENTSNFLLNTFISGIGLSEKQKFKGRYSYLEIFLNEGENVEKIVYKRLLL